MSLRTERSKDPQSPDSAACHCGRSEAKIRNPLITDMQGLRFESETMNKKRRCFWELYLRPYAGINPFRFKGYDLSPLKAPLKISGQR